MKEQSHKEEMSRALRGDFERLRGRGVASTLAPREVEEPVGPVPTGEPEALPLAPDTVNEDPGGPGRGWLGRLLGR